MKPVRRTLARAFAASQDADGGRVTGQSRRAPERVHLANGE